jgi:hypothetical protein
MMLSQLNLPDDKNTRMDHKCTVCGKVFRVPAHLKRHRERKTPCTPIIEGDKTETTCRYCGRVFASKQSMNRHIRESCKIANSDEGMEKLMDHTLQRQLAEQKSQLDRLTTLLEQQTFLIEKITGSNNQTMVLTDNSIKANINATVNAIFVTPWDKSQVNLDITQVIAAFAENPRLKEYVRLDDEKKIDPDIGPPYVADFLMDLTRRIHADPTSRNVYLSPNRADQVLVLLSTGSWEVRPAIEAIRALNDGIVQKIIEISRDLNERKRLPIEQQNALAMAGLLYDDEPEEYAKRLKGPMAAHFANMRPTLLQLAAIRPRLIQN